MLTACDSGTSARSGVVDVAVARGGESSGRGVRMISERRAVVERERAVGARLGVPEVDQLLQALGLLRGEVVQLGAVDVGVVELPRVRRRSGSSR